MNIEVVEEISDLERNVHRFTFFEQRQRLALVLDCFQVLTRASKRHGWKVGDKYDRLDGRNATILREPAVPEAIKAKALEIFRNQIQVLTWKEWRGLHG